MGTGSWTVTVCRSQPGARETADALRARGAQTVWCGPDCCSGEEDRMSVFDDGSDLMEPVMETRGGEHPDWENARPGEPLPELPDDA